MTKAVLVMIITCAAALCQYSPPSSGGLSSMPPNTLAGNSSGSTQTVAAISPSAPANMKANANLALYAKLASGGQCTTWVVK